MLISAFESFFFTNIHSIGKPSEVEKSAIDIISSSKTILNGCDSQSKSRIYNFEMRTVLLEKNLYSSAKLFGPYTGDDYRQTSVLLKGLLHFEMISD